MWVQFKNQLNIGRVVLVVADCTSIAVTRPIQTPHAIQNCKQSLTPDFGKLTISEAEDTSAGYS